MKIIRIILLSLFALGLIVLTAVFVFYQTFDTDRYLLQIARSASTALGRPVSITAAGLGISSTGITLNAGPVSVADDSDFTSQPFIKIDRIIISVDLKGLIFQHKIQITDILLQSPQVHFIRSVDGRLNVQSIFQEGGFIDQRSKPKDMLHAPLDPSFGRGLGMVPKVIHNSPLKDSALIQALPVKSIRIQDASISFIDQNQMFPLNVWLTEANLKINDFSLSNPFPLSFSACILSKVSNVHASSLVFLDLSRRSVQLSDLKVDMDLSRLDLETLKGISPGISEGSIIENMAGKIQLNIAHMDINPAKDPVVNGEISVTGGVIRHFNIIKTILSHVLGVLDGLGVSIDHVLSSSLRDQSSLENTLIDKAEAKFLYHDKILFIDESTIQTNIFEFSAKGTIDRESNLDMRTVLHFNADLSEGLARELEGLKYLYDDTGRIAVGASLRGVIPHLKYKPDKDFRKKSKKMLMEEGGNILGALLGGGSVSPQSSDPALDQSKKAKKKFKNFLKSILQ